ncbi:MAG: DUF1698 domain-containing protein [Myxococcota bacterium]
MRVLRRLKHLALRTVAPILAPRAPLTGYAPGKPLRLIDRLADAELDALNRILPWKAFTADGRGRRFGGIAWTGKRCAPQSIPDRRIEILDEHIGLADKTVLEIGCFEGIHTVALAERSRSVIAVDARVENVVKTIIRTTFYDVRPTVLVCNVEKRPLPVDLLEADVVHHVGVLYHLADPVTHLGDLAALARQAIFLDTHYATDADARREYTVGGRSFRYRPFVESGAADPFSGMSGSSKWLRLEDICALLRGVGFGDVEIIEERRERNGPRALILAKRPSSGDTAPAPTP